MRGNFGTYYKLSIFGESHGAGIGIIIDGIPAGTPVDEDFIAAQMQRRAPGRDPTATARKEADAVEILSGVLNGRACGTPVCGLIRNTNTRSGDYSELAVQMRPGHADLASQYRYHGFADPRGGGHFSGRLTAPVVFAGSIAKSMLSTHGITIGSHIHHIGSACDDPFDPVHIDTETLSRLSQSHFPVLRATAEAEMREVVENAKSHLDSVGGAIECAALVPPGLGAPFFGSLESVFSQLAFSIPAVKAVEFGDGTAMGLMNGSQANDPMRISDDVISCTSNHNGGVTGGITNGMPVLCRVTFKPTPSIGQSQQTVNISTHENVDLIIHGRHDPCIVPRAAVVVESIMAITLQELFMEQLSLQS